MFIRGSLIFVLSLTAPLLCKAADVAHSTDAGYDTTVRPFLEANCFDCHGEDKQKGDLRVDTLARNFVNTGTAMHWSDIMDRINSGEMPPKKRPRPNPADAGKVTDWIAQQLADAESARQAASGEKVSFRRLSREEYRNTIRDLLHVTYDATDPSGLPIDPDWLGFERIGPVLTLSATHVEKYLAAADSVLNEALAVGPQPMSRIEVWSGHEMRARNDISDALLAKGIRDKVRADVVPNNGALDARDWEIKQPGDYVVHVKLSGLPGADGRAARFRLYVPDLGRTLFEQDINAPEDAPIVLEFHAHLPVGTHLVRIVNAVPGPNPEGRQSRPWNAKPFFTMKARQPWQLKLSDEDYKPLMPTLLIDYVQWEGPVQPSWPPPAHKEIFFAGEAAPKNLDYARQILTRFTTRAFRRPASSGQVDRLVALVDNSMKLGDSFEVAVKDALMAVLCSDNFLYLIEGSTTAPSPRLTDYELASRLSYFLWSTMPDEQLMELAGSGKLHEPAVLHEQVQRMLHDPRSAAFADSFPRQWLQLRRVGMFVPDKNIYPDYDPYLETSMIGETTSFFREVLDHNLSVKNFIDSDWTMLNGRLAQFYGISGVTGEAMQRVALMPDEHRGGLLTDASILSLTSDGTRHRPVHRGKWVLESIYGNPPPPPPPNVGDIKPTPPNHPKTSLREKIEQHRADPACASCHRKIDPLGMAFDNFDAIGRWRTEESVRDGAGANPAIDPSGELPDGRKFADSKGLKQLMLADIDRFNAAFVKKLATYAMRRGMNYDDRKDLADIAAQSKAADYKLASIVESLVTSNLFQKR